MIAAVYARKSTEQTGVADEQKSVARQIDHAKAYAERKGWTVADEHVYVDDGISGAEFANQPGFLRLMNALKPRAPFQALIMSEVSRLGREQIETAYALKQLSTAGVRCFSYLEGRELLMESATDQFLPSAITFAADLEREKARQRTRDAMVRKAHAGHVTGGGCLGYRNVESVGPDGRRSHVERVIEPAKAAVIRRIFQLSAEGYGVKAITKRLNADGALSPRPQRGRPQTWSPSSVWEVLRKPIYRGELVYAQTAKRDKWGQKRQAARPESGWIRVQAPALAIVTAEAWTAAHARIEAARAVYLKSGGQAFSRPALRNSAKDLLANLANCSVCGQPFSAQTRHHGHAGSRQRKRFYGCAGHRDRGTCSNRRVLPMEDGDAIVVEALLDDVIEESIVKDAVGEAIALLRSEDEGAAAYGRHEAQLAAVTSEHRQLMDAVKAGEQVVGLLEALRALDGRRRDLETRRAMIASQRPVSARDSRRLGDE